MYKADVRLMMEPRPMLRTPYRPSMLRGSCFDIACDTALIHSTVPVTLISSTLVSSSTEASRIGVVLSFPTYIHEDRKLYDGTSKAEEDE